MFGEDFELVREGARVYAEDFLELAEARVCFSQKQDVEDLEVPFLREKVEALFEGLHCVFEGF